MDKNVFWVSRDKRDQTDVVAVWLGAAKPLSDDDGDFSDRENYPTPMLYACIENARKIGIRLRKGQCKRFRITAEEVSGS